MARRLRSGTASTSLEVRFQSCQMLTPERLHSLGLLGVGEPCVLDRDSAFRVPFRVEPDDHPGLALAPVEACRPRPCGRPLTQLAFWQPAGAQRLVDEDVE